ncbi:hypothetical protein BDR22DRAFT_883848 [Usnea florida]
MPPLQSSPAVAISLLKHPLELRSLLPSFHNLTPRLPSQDIPILPTRTTSLSHTLTSLLRRQTTVTTTANPIIPATYSGLNSGPTPGTVVGIVLGSVAGFLLLLWLIYTCFGLGGLPGRSSVVEEEVIRRRSRSPSRRAPSRRPSTRRSSPRRTVVESSISASEVVMEEVHRERTPPPPRRSSRVRETVVVEEIRRPPPSAPREDEFVEVIEERDDPPPRRPKKPSGFRNVDPEAFGGGDGRFKRVSSRR